jgi:uncharacterized protein (DUF433 family)
MSTFARHRTIYFWKFQISPWIRTSKRESLHFQSRVYPTAATMKQDHLIDRITSNPDIFGGKPIIRGRRLAVEHVLGMLAAGDDPATILKGFPWLEQEDIQACLVYASMLARHERIELFPTALAS